MTLPVYRLYETDVEKVYIHVQDDKVFVCDTDSKRKNKLNTQVKEHHRRNIVFDSPEKQIMHTKRDPQNHESPHQKSFESRNTQTFEGDTRNYRSVSVFC